MAAVLDDLALLDRLIGFDTTSVKSNLALIDWVANYLDGHGIASRLTYDADRQKANLLDRKSTRLNSSHLARSRMPSSA